MKILAIIPARGGSKGIPNKNRQLISGIPLIGRSIQFSSLLLNQNLISRVIVSTDDDSLRTLSLSYGADVPFLRPNEFSTDKAPAAQYVQHAYDYMDSIGEHYDATLILQPTSPFRTINTFTKAINIFTCHKLSSCISCYREEYVCDSVSYSPIDQFHLIPSSTSLDHSHRRQDNKITLVRNGSLYLTAREFFMTYHRLVSDKPGYVLMNKIDSINIDTFDDLELAKAISC